MDYRRYHQRGAMVFITLVTHRRAPVLLQPLVNAALRQGVAHVARAHPMQTVAYVVLPDHCHLLWQLPETDGDFSVRVRLVKHFMTRQPDLPHPIWQQRFWDHLIRDEEDFHRHLDYIHFNPVKHGHCRAAVDWRQSSFRTFLEESWYAPDWGVAADADPSQFGE